MPDFTLPELTVVPDLFSNDLMYLVRGGGQDRGVLYSTIKADILSGTVASVFGRTGVVVATTNDYSVSQINGLQAALDAKLAIAAAAGLFQPLSIDLTALDALVTQTFGRSLLTMADAASARAILGAPGFEANEFQGIQEVVVTAGPAMTLEVSGTSGAVLLVKATDVGYAGNLIQVSNAPTGTVFTLNEVGDIDTVGRITGASFRVGGNAGATGTFTTVDSKTVTVTGGLITAITP